MADEITFSCSLSGSKGGASASGSCSGTATLDGAEMIASVQSQSTTGAAINVGGCDSLQAVYLFNMDSSISITVGLTNGNPPTNVVSVIPPQKGVLLWAPGTLYAASASGTPNLYVVVFET